MMRQRVTIADVARLAEVSAGTVSNVLNGKAAVRPEPFGSYTSAPIHWHDH